MNKTFSNQRGNLILELRQNPVSAWLTIKRTNRLIDELEILTLLETAGLKTGFDEALEYIREHSLEREFDVPFPIAISNYDSSEAETRLIHHFDPKPIREFFLSRNLGILEGITYVEEGEVIAAYSNNIFASGNSIYDIFGELIVPAQVDTAAAKLLVGRNVAYEGTEYFALKTGYPFLDDEGRICILDKLSVDPATCSASFRTPLALELHGDLVDCNLMSGSDITIHGKVRTSSIFCQGNLTVEGDIEACTNPGVQVLGQLRVYGIRSSRVLTRGDIVFDAPILDSTIACDGEIIGTTGQSRISGGLCQGFTNIDIDSAGDSDGTETEIEISISPFYRSMLMQMTKELIRRRNDGEASELEDLQARIKRCETEMDAQLNDFLQRGGADKRFVRIRSDVYPKTTIRILKHSYPIKNHQQGLEIFEKE